MDVVALAWPLAGRVGFGAIAGGAPRAEGSHWTERAQALLAPLLHAAALDGATMRTLLTWVDRRQALPAQQILAGEPGRSTELAAISSMASSATDERELSASGPPPQVRSPGSLRPGVGCNVSPRFRRRPVRDLLGHHLHCRASSPPAPGRPMVVGLIDDIRHATYARSAASNSGACAGSSGPCPRRGGQHRPVPTFLP